MAAAATTGRTVAVTLASSCRISGMVWAGWSAPVDFPAYEQQFNVLRSYADGDEFLGSFAGNLRWGAGQFKEMNHDGTSNM